MSSAHGKATVPMSGLQLGYLCNLYKTVALGLSSWVLLTRPLTRYKGTRDS